MTHNQLFILLTGLFLMSCFILFAFIIPKDVHIKKPSLGSPLHYVKDDRTGLCFAYKEFYTHNSNYIKSLTYVPCTKEVLNLINNP